MIMAFASRQIAVPLLDNNTQSTRRHFTGKRTNRALVEARLAIEIAMLAKAKNKEFGVLGAEARVGDTSWDAIALIATNQFYEIGMR